MLLTNTNEFQLYIDNIQVPIKITFKILENIYNLINDIEMSSVFDLKVKTPFDLIENIDDKENIIALLYCCCQGKIDTQDIKEIINDLDKLNLEAIKRMVRASIVTSLIDNTEDKKEETKGDESTFDDYYNYLYLSATTQLGFSKEQFYNSTPSELKQLLNNDMLHKKNVLIRAYIDVMEARNKSVPNNKKEENVIQASDANEFFNLI